MLLVKANYCLFSYSVFLVLEIKTLKLTSYISAKAGFIWFITRYIKNIKLFREVFALDYLWPLFSPVLTSRTPAKNVFLENVIFWRHRLSLGHSGQKVPKSPVFQL